MRKILVIGVILIVACSNPTNAPKEKECNGGYPQLLKIRAGEFADSLYIRTGNCVEKWIVVEHEQDPDYEQEEIIIGNIFP